MGAPLESIAAFLVRRRLPVLVGAVLAVLALAWPLGRLEFGYSIAGFLRSEDPELAAATAHYEQGFPIPDNLLLFAWAEEEPLGEAALGRLRRLVEAFGEHPMVQRVISAVSAPGIADPREAASSSTWRRFLVGRDGGALGGVLVLGPGGNDALLALFEDLRAAARVEGVDLHLAGHPHHRADHVAMLRADQRLFLPLATVVAGVFLLWFVPGIRLALLALSIAPLTVVATMGTMALQGVEVTMLTSSLPTLLLAMAVADGVHVVGRYSELRRGGTGPEAAARAAFARTFFPCLLTSVTTMLGFSSLCVAEMGDLRELGLYAAVGIGYAFVLTMVVLPAALSAVRAVVPERRVDLPGAVARGAARLIRVRPWWVLGPALGLLGVLMVGATGVRQDHRLGNDTFADSPHARSVRFYEEHFVAQVPGEVLVEAPGGVGGEAAFAELEEVVRRLEALPGMDRTLSVVDLVRDGLPWALVARMASSGRMPVGLLGEGGEVARVLTFQRDPGTRALRAQRREVASWNDDLEHVEVRVAGVRMVGAELVGRLVGDLGRSFAGSVVLVFALVAWQFRSVRLGWIAMVPCLFPLVGNLAVMAWAGIALRPLTVITFCIAFGLSVDDTVHLLARYREERRAGRGRGEALRQTVRTAGRPVVVTTLLLLVGFGVLLASAFKGVFLFGVLVGLALVGSMVGALVLLPGLLQVTR